MAVRSFLKLEIFILQAGIVSLELLDLLLDSLGLSVCLKLRVVALQACTDSLETSVLALELLDLPLDRLDLFVQMSVDVRRCVQG